MKTAAFSTENKAKQQLKLGRGGRKEEQRKQTKGNITVVFVF